MNSEGIGLGLMICKSLIEQNEGRFSVHSAGAEMGSVFMFTMRMAIVEGQNLGTIKQVVSNESLEILDQIHEIESQHNEREKHNDVLSDRYTQQKSQPHKMLQESGENFLEMSVNQPNSEKMPSIQESMEMRRQKHADILMIVSNDFTREALACTLMECFQLGSELASDADQGLQLIEARLQGDESMFKLVLIEI